MSLLDDLVKDHQAQLTTEEVEAARAKDEAARAQRAREARAALAEKAPPVETSPRRWGHDPDAHVAGMRAGDVFEMVDCGDDLDGEWLVEKIQGPPVQSGKPRFLLAARRGGGPPFAKIGEADFEAEVAEGRILRRGEKG